MRLHTLRHNSFLSKLIGIGATSNDLEQNKKIGIVNGVSIITGSLAFGIGTFLFILSSDRSIGIPALIETGLFAIVVYLNYRRQYLAAGLLGHIIQNLAVLYFGTLLGRVVDAQIMTVFLVGVPLFIFKQLGIRFACIATTFLTMFFLELNTYYGFIAPIEIAPQYHFIFRIVSIGSILFLNVLVIFLYEYNNIRLVKKLKVSNDNLQRVSMYKSIHVKEINHELKGPMHTIHSISQVLKEQLNLTQEQVTLYRHLHHSSQHAIEIINNVLELSAIEAGKIPALNLEPVMVGSLVNDICQWHQPMAEKKHVTILFRTAQNVPTCIESDKTKFTQVISNLLVNALKFSPDRGIVFVFNYYDEDFLYIRITDQGPGMGPEKLATLFTEFVTESNDLVSGTGLGLHISQQIADRMGGAIGVKSVPERGSTFTLRIPCVPIEPEEVLSKEEEEDDENLEPMELNKSVYFFEDNRMHALYLKKYLIRWGCNFAESELAIPGIEEIATFQPDIILLDAQLPDGKAVEILPKLQAHKEIAHIPVIVITGESYKDQIRAIENAGAVCVISKPVNYQKLYLAIKKHALDMIAIIKD